ncbi:MAG: DNA adenine methylase [Promethearchaeota archaeon]
MKPLLKWAGGKRSLTERITNLFSNIQKSKSYHEPFFGGGAVFFNLEPKKGSINDINSRLMNFYKIVKDHPCELIEQASNYKYEKTEYYKHRTRFNEKPENKIEDAALFLYLNRTGYNGLYRVNSKGDFNVPFGRYINPTIIHKDRIHAASKILQNIRFHNGDFTYVLDEIEKGDLCYLDPPYFPTSKTANFTTYSRGGFQLSDQKRLKNLCIELTNAGVQFVQSNSDTQFIRELYETTEFELINLKTKRLISCKVSTRRSGYELLITNSHII